MRLNSPFPKHVCSVVRSLSETLANACKFWIFYLLSSCTEGNHSFRFFCRKNRTFLSSFLRKRCKFSDEPDFSKPAWNFLTALFFTVVDLANSRALTPNVYDNGNAIEVFIDLVMIIGYFRVPETLTFKMRLGTQPFLWKWVLFAREWKLISISKAEHLPGPGELENGLFGTVQHLGRYGTRVYKSQKRGGHGWWFQFRCVDFS